MPSKSKSQQRFFGMVDAYKKGELDHASKSIKDAAENMTSKEVKKFAKTKHKGLPEKVKQKKIKESFGSNEYLNAIRDAALECNADNIEDFADELSIEFDVPFEDVLSDINLENKRKRNCIKLTEEQITDMVKETVKKYFDE